jgi:ABC-type nitrate/sulfonate/bicarbonate transport system permease component
MTRIRYALGACAFALLLWQGIVWLTGVPSFILPSPLRVAQAALDNRVLIAENALVTATEVILGLIIGTVLGGPDPDALVRLWNCVQGRYGCFDYLLSGHVCVL